jgi:hypothetical protein
MRFLTGLACSFACAFLQTPAHAAFVLLDNTNGLDTTNLSNTSQTTWLSNPTDWSRINGYTFVVGSDPYDISSVSIPLRWSQPGAISPTMRVSIWENASPTSTTPAGGATPLYQEDFTAAGVDSTYRYFTFAPTGTWLLEADTNYSIGFLTDQTASSASLTWSGFNPLGSTPSGSYGLASLSGSSGFFSFDGGSSFGVSASAMVYGFQLTGATPGGSVPAPGSIALLVSGLVMGGLLRRLGKRAGNLTG